MSDMMLPRRSRLELFWLDEIEEKSTTFFGVEGFDVGSEPMGRGNNLFRSA